MNRFENIANSLVEKLSQVGIKAYIWHLATTGSVYIRFEDNRMCSIRIGDHNGRGKLKYKYNLRSDLRGEGKWVKDNGIWRYYLPIDKWEEIIPILSSRNEQIKGWEPSRYSYHIPSFKR